MPLGDVWRRVAYWDQVVSYVSSQLSGYADTSSVAAKADRALTTNTQAGASYTLPANASTLSTRLSSASAKTLVLPNDASSPPPINEPCVIINSGAGIATINAQTGGATVTVRPANGLRMVSQWDLIVVTRIASNEYLVKGDAVV